MEKQKALIKSKNEYNQFIATYATIAIGLLAIAVIAIVLIDPFYHYHAPIEPIKLIPEKQAYQNVGMAKQLEYDAILTGSSMTENFKVSELNKLFECDTVKLSFEGGRVPNYDILFNEAFNNENVDIKKVFYSCDISAYIDNPNAEPPNKIPEYLYDGNIFTDVKYVLNKTVLFDYALPHLKDSLNNNILPLDEAYAWYKLCDFSEKGMRAQYVRPKQEDKQESNIFEENVKVNLEKIGKYIKENPNTEFNMFFPPYSILYYDSWNRQGKLEAVLYAQEMVAEYFVQFPNVKLSSFLMDTEIICNLNNYKDYTHYSEKINEFIAEKMKDGSYLLTTDNVDTYFVNARNFLLNYNYGALFN